MNKFDRWFMRHFSVLFVGMILIMVSLVCYVVLAAMSVKHPDGAWCYVTSRGINFDTCITATPERK